MVTFAEECSLNQSGTRVEIAFSKLQNPIVRIPSQHLLSSVLVLIFAREQERIDWGRRRSKIPGALHSDGIRGQLCEKTLQRGCALSLPVTTQVVPALQSNRQQSASTATKLNEMSAH